MRKGPLIRPRWRKRVPRLPAALGVSLGIAICALLGMIPIGIWQTGPISLVKPEERTVKALPMPPAASALLHEAEQRLVQDCMRRHGFSYWPTPVTDDSEQPLLQFPYLIDDVSWARQNGFGGENTAEADPNWRYFYTTLPVSRRPGYMTALGGAEGSPGVEVKLPNGTVLGHSKDGCMAAAATELYGNYAAWFQAVNFVGDLKPLSQARALSDSRYAAAMRNWSRCIQARGYPGGTPFGLAQKFGTSAGPRQRAAHQAAIAEAECVIRTGLAQEARQLAASYYSAILGEYDPEVQVYRRLQAAAIPRAREIMAGQPNR